MDRRRESSRQRRSAEEAVVADETAEEQLDRMMQEVQSGSSVPLQVAATAEASTGFRDGGSTTTLAGDARMVGDAPARVEVRRMTAGPEMTGGSAASGAVARPAQVGEALQPPGPLEGVAEGRVEDVPRDAGSHATERFESPMDFPPGLPRGNGEQGSGSLDRRVETGVGGQTGVPSRPDAEGFVQPPRVEVQVNPFWSAPRKAYERLSVESSVLGYHADVPPPEIQASLNASPEVGLVGERMGRSGSAGLLGALSQTPAKDVQENLVGGFLGSVGTTPQKDWPSNQAGGLFGETPQKDDVVMDPVELFRLRCLREAEERFRKGVEAMTANQKGRSPERGQMRLGLESQGSQASWKSAESGDAGGLNFTPPPPPGPPPASPPRHGSHGHGSVGYDINQGTHVGHVAPKDVQIGVGDWSFVPPPPPLPPVPPMPMFDGMPRDIHVRGENPAETLRSFELPRLSIDSSPVQFGDWYSLTDSYMYDLSYSSGMWWEMVRVAAEKCYKEWLVADPLNRLRLKPQVSPEAGGWPRTEKRALAIILQAVPEVIRSDLISSRRLTVDQVLFKLLITFQPGGATEKTKLLRTITDGACGSTPVEVTAWVRSWRQNVTRASELGLTLPDAMVLVGTLQAASDWLGMQNPQLAYRLNMVRQQLNLDQQPSFGAVWTYSEHVLAEAEGLVNGSVVGVSGMVGNPQKSTGPKASIKALNAQGLGNMNAPNETGSKEGKHASPQKGVQAVNAEYVTSNQPCHFWGTPDGCKRADKCKFVHAILSSKDNKCFACSSEGHSKKECPHVSYSQNPKKVAKAKTKDSPQKVDKVKGGEPRNDSKGGGGGKVEVKEVAAPSAPADASARVGVESVNSTGGDPSGDRIDQMLQEATNLMKSLQPSVRAVNVKVQMQKASTASATGLLDGGATNALRVGTKDELARALPVRVELASGTTMLHQDLQTGTLLTSTPVEPIVPVRGLIGLGYRINCGTVTVVLFIIPKKER